MHSLKIVHCDIKPQNIAFSPNFDDLIFLDFGLTRIIKERAGEKTMTAFMGTYLYVSSAMKTLIHGGKSPIDLYHNDKCCLVKTKKSANSLYVEPAKLYELQEAYLDFVELSE